MYHMTNSGLDNVWLENGYKTGTDKFGPYYNIKDIPGLYRAILLVLAHGRGELTARELRIIRRNLKLTQKELAEALGRKEQTVLLWERDRIDKQSAAIPADAARQIKFMILRHYSPSIALNAAFQHVDQPRPNRIVMTHRSGHWICAINGDVVHATTVETWDDTVEVWDDPVIAGPYPIVPICIRLNLPLPELAIHQSDIEQDLTGPESPQWTM